MTGSTASKKKPATSSGKRIAKKTLLEAWEKMCQAKRMAEVYEENKAETSKYVHATSRGHEAMQLALALQLLPQDMVAPYYRDDSILLGIGMSPYELILQLRAKRDDPFSGGRTYYSHPSLNREDMPKIPHQSSATGMQTIPITGAAMGVQYMENQGLAPDHGKDKPVVVCSLGDAAITEGEISEAFQMAVLKEMPMLYFIQDNEWDISADAKETRAQDATEFARGFKGMEVRTIDQGNDFFECYRTLREIMETIRKERRPFLVHGKVPLLGHHTSGVRMEWYRDDLEEHQQRDPNPKFREQLLEHGIGEKELDRIEKKAREQVDEEYEKADNAEDPRPEDLYDHDFAPTPITEEKGVRAPEGNDPTVMVDSALIAMREILTTHPEALLYGQDVGGRLGGVFREAATLAQQFGDERVFNTPIQEAFIIGSTVGMSAAGTRPIVEVQFADYIWPGLNQLFTELSRSYYLSNGKWNVNSVIRVPCGAYGSGGPYHSSSAETVVTSIHGVKVAYPSTGADLKGLLKAAFYDPNPVVVFEHKGLYWSKKKGTEEAKTIVPDENYVLPFGKARIALEADNGTMEEEATLAVITYGMGVYWAKNAAKGELEGKVEVVDLRTLIPWDEETVFAAVRRHNRCLVVTEEPSDPSYARTLSGKIQRECFEALDAPVDLLGSENMPGIPLNSTLEATMIPNEEKVGEKIRQLLAY